MLIKNKAYTYLLPSPNTHPPSTEACIRLTTECQQHVVADKN